MEIKRIDSTLPALYQPQYPVLYEAKKIKKPWFNKKIQAVKWSDFFEIEKNKMITFRIIPHANVANNNKRLFKSLHKMYEMYEGMGSRLERDGFKFHFREKDYFWFDVLFKQQNGEKKIEFYVSTSEYQAGKLKRKLQNKMNVTIKEAFLTDLYIPEENTIVQELKYLKHDIFSLNTNTNDTKTPIAAILNTVDELTFDGDVARLSVCNEVESRQKWIKGASWAFEKLNKGKVPQRANMGGKQLLNASKIALAGVVNEINDLLTDTFQAIQNSFLKSEKDFKKDKVVKKAYSLEDEINSKRLSGSTYEKINSPVFKSHIRVAAHSMDRLTRETMGETLGMAFNEIAENNELSGIKINVNGRRIQVINEINTLQLSNKTKYDPNVNLISSDEMTKLTLQMPTSELQRRYADALSVNRKVETDIPAAMLDSSGIKLGVAEVKDKTHTVYLPYKNPDDFYRGYTFIGSQGMGKDNSIQNFVVESCLKHGISFIIPDAICEEGERGMADGIRDSLPPEKVIDIDLSNENYIAPMDLTEVISKLGRKGASRFADEMIDFINIEGLSRSQKYLTDAAKASGGSLYNIKRIIEDEDYRINRIADLISEGNERLARELVSWGTNEELGGKADPILNRLNMFFGNDTLFDIFAQDPIPELAFDKWQTEGKVIIIRIPNRKLGSLATKTLMHWVVLKSFMTRMLMSNEEKAKGAFIVFNEPEQYMTEGLSKLMGRIATEGRKERFGSLFAFHHWNKLPQSLQENLIAGGVNQFLFANDHKRTFELAKERMEPTFTIEDAMKTPKHHAINILRLNGEPAHAFLVHMSPPCPKPYDNSFLTKRHAQMYGRRYEELQKIIL